MEPDRIVNKMLQHDFFSQWLGIEVVKITKGYCKLKMVVTRDMLNGFGIAHGGITYSLADSCLAFASNSNGKHALSIETSISHTFPAREGDTLFAESIEQNKSNKIGLYSIVITNQNKEKIAFFKGTVYIKSKEWEL